MSNEKLLLAIMKAHEKSETHQKKHMKHLNRWWELTARYAENILDDNGIAKGDKLLVDGKHSFQKIYEVNHGHFVKPSKGVSISVCIPGFEGVMPWSLNVKQCLAAKRAYKLQSGCVDNSEEE